MKIYSPNIAVTGKQSFFEVTAGLKSKINFLILMHLLVFALYVINERTGFVGQTWANETMDEFIKYNLVISSKMEDFVSHWWSSLLAYQFIHFNSGELILSVSMLWFFGHILQNRIGQFKVILLYFGFSVLSAAVFYLSHLIFPIYSGPHGIMQGAFGGVLGIMSTTVFLYGRYRLQLSQKTSIELWKIFMAALLVSFMLVYENNMAYILIYAVGIYAGKECADKIEEGREVTNGGR